MKKKLLLIVFTIMCVLPFKVNAMQIFVKVSEDIRYNLEVDPSDSIESVKYDIYYDHDVPKEYQILMYDGEVLQDNRTLADYNIQKEYILDLDVQGVVVDGESLTSSNPNNTDSTAIYNVEEKTLTLNNYNGGAIKYYGDDELNIILKGNNTITIEEYSDFGIESLLGDIKFTGNGSLTITGSMGAIYAQGKVEIDNTTLVVENAFMGGIISYGETIINGNVDIESYAFPIMTESDVIIDGGNVDLKAETIGIFISGEGNKGSLYINGGIVNIVAGGKDTGAAVLILKNEDGQGIFIDDNMYVVQEGISLQEANVEYNSDTLTGYTFGNAYGNVIIYEMSVEAENAANELTIKVKEPNPNTGDNIVSFIIIGGISLIGLTVCGISLKSKRFN